MTDCPWCDGTIKAAFERGETIVETVPICDACKGRLDAMWEEFGDKLIFPAPAATVRK